MLSPETRISLESSSDAQEFYLNLIGKSQMPEVSELPVEILLPSGFLVPIRDAIERTKTDGRERSGDLRWDPKNKKLISHKYPVGSEDLSVMFPYGRKKILSYHTHPGGYPWPSPLDIESSLIHPHHSFINAVAGTEDLVAFIQTKQQDLGRLGIFPRFGALMEITENENGVRIPEVLEQNGFGCYKGSLRQPDVLLKRIR